MSLKLNSNSVVSLRKIYLKMATLSGAIWTCRILLCSPLLDHLTLAHAHKWWVYNHSHRSLWRLLFTPKEQLIHISQKTGQPQVTEVTYWFWARLHPEFKALLWVPLLTHIHCCATWVCLRTLFLTYFAWLHGFNNLLHAYVFQIIIPVLSSLQHFLCRDIWTLVPPCLILY